MELEYKEDWERGGRVRPADGYVRHRSAWPRGGKVRSSTALSSR